MNLLQHYKNNYRQWKQYTQILSKDKRSPLDYFPSETYFKYPPNHTFGGKKVLNFGCGNSVYTAPNVLNVDIVAKEGVIVRDPSRSLSQFGTDFDFIIANHVLEHVPNWFDCFTEMVSILKPGGKLEVYIPPVSSDSAFTFRDHINRIGMRSFDGIGPKAFAGCNLFCEKEFSQFTHLKKIMMIEHQFRPCIKWWTMLAWPSLLRFIITHLRNVVSEERYLFVKLP